MNSRQKIRSSDKQEVDEVLGISTTAIFDPLVSFVFRLITTIFTRLAVVVLFGFGGLLGGAVVGLPTGPGVAITAAVGGALGLLIGGWWEFQRLDNGMDYDDYLE